MTLLLNRMKGAGVAVMNGYGLMVLHLAARDGHKNVIAPLLDMMEGIGVVVMDEDGMTTLH